MLRSFTPVKIQRLRPSMNSVWKEESVLQVLNDHEDSIQTARLPFDAAKRQNRKKKSSCN